jgi:putative ubiquitin-RnfH superfamily antitoxin RatB of RatAB toxin-antitoxin module
LKPSDDTAVTVAYAPSPNEQRIVQIRVPRGSTVQEAIRASGLLDAFWTIDPAQLAVGIFGERVPLDRCVEDGDRVEIYRPLLADPKDARRRRAKRGPRG